MNPKEIVKHRYYIRINWIKPQLFLKSSDLSGLTKIYSFLPLPDHSRSAGSLTPHGHSGTQVTWRHGPLLTHDSMINRTGEGNIESQVMAFIYLFIYLGLAERLAGS